MPTPLTAQELHNLAMNVVGKQLEEDGYEFLAVNSKLKKDPQFVALKGGKLHFVVVRAVSYPNDPRNYDPIEMEKMREHALAFPARTFYAGVGLANSNNPEVPIHYGEDYYLKYHGWQEITA